MQATPSFSMLQWEVCNTEKMGVAWDKTSQLVIVPLSSCAFGGRCFFKTSNRLKCRSFLAQLIVRIRNLKPCDCGKLPSSSHCEDLEYRKNLLSMISKYSGDRSKAKS